MHLEIVDGLVGRHQRLSEHLPAIDLRAADITTLASEKIDLESLELELSQKIGNTDVHEALTPSRFCITGLVVVY